MNITILRQTTFSQTQHLPVPIYVLLTSFTFFTSTSVIFQFRNGFFIIWKRNSPEQGQKMNTNDIHFCRSVRKVSQLETIGIHTMINDMAQKTVFNLTGIFTIASQAILLNNVEMWKNGSQRRMVQGLQLPVS